MSEISNEAVKAIQDSARTEAIGAESNQSAIWVFSTVADDRAPYGRERQKERSALIGIGLTSEESEDAESVEHCIADRHVSCGGAEARVEALGELFARFGGKVR